MKVEKVKIDSLTVDPENARKHSKRNIDAIAKSLENFGQRRPLVVWDNIIIAGNGTVEAANSLGWKDIEITRVPTEWTSDQARAYALADNRTAELADWDPDLLSNQLIDLNGMGFNVAELGFTLNREDGSGGFLNDLMSEVDETFEDDGKFVAETKFPLPYGFSATQRELILKAIKKAKDQEETDAPSALTSIAEQYLEGK